MYTATDILPLIDASPTMAPGSLLTLFIFLESFLYCSKVIFRGGLAVASLSAAEPLTVAKDLDFARLQLRSALASSWVYREGNGARIKRVLDSDTAIITL